MLTGCNENTIMASMRPCVNEAAASKFPSKTVVVLVESVHVSCG